MENEVSERMVEYSVGQRGDTGEKKYIKQGKHQRKHVKRRKTITSPETLKAFLSAVAHCLCAR